MKKSRSIQSISTILLAILTVMVSATDVQAKKYSEAEIEKLIKETAKLVIENKQPTAQQKQMIDDLAQQVQSGEMKRDYILELAKKEIFDLVDRVKFNHYDIAKAMKVVPKLIPTVTPEEFHALVWEKVHTILKDTIHMKVGTLAPEGTAWLDVPRTILNKHLSKVSNGKVKIKMYTGGVMGEDVDILRKMDMGQLDGCGCTALGVFKASPELGVLFLPMMFRNYAEVDHILSKFRDEFDKSLKKKGYVLASLIDTGFFYLWTKNPIRSLADIKRQRMMTWFGPVESTTYQELGISPIPISVPEVVTSLNTGIVDATYGPGPWILGTQAYTNLKYYVTQPLFYSPAAIFFTDKIKNRFKGKYSDISIHNFQELLIYETMNFEHQWIHKYLRPYEKKAMKAFQKYGIKPVTLSKADMDKIEAASKRVWYKLADKVYPKSLLERVLKELEKFRQGK